MADEPRIIEEKIVGHATEAEVSAAASKPVSAAPPVASAQQHPTQQDAAAPPMPVPRPVPPLPPSPPPPPPSQPLPPPTARPALQTDISKILREVKLPERRMQTAPSAPEGQAPALGVLPQMEPRAAPAAIPIAPDTPDAPAREIPAAVTPQSPAMGAPVAAAPTPEIPAVVIPPKQPLARETEETTVPPISSVHTMKNDLQDVVRERKISVVRAAALEQDRQREAPAPLIEAPRKGGALGLIVASILVFVVLGAAALYAVQLLTNSNAPHTQGVGSASVIFAENQVSLALDNQPSAALRQTLGGMLSQAGSVGSITQIVPTLAASAQAGQRAATLAEFFAALGVKPPDQLVRALGGDFFFGIHMADVPAPVFIIPVVSYDNAFAGMLAWEATMDPDLAPLFRQVPAITADPQGGLPVARQFKDLVVRNYDVRGLEDDSGAIVLYYSFPTPQILIIAASPYTFPEVLSRLQAERKL